MVFNILMSMSCLGLIYVILLVNSKEKFVIMIKRCFFVRVSRGAWLGARVCNWAVARAARVHPWPRALEAGPAHIQNALIFLSVFNEIYLSIDLCINCCKIKLSFSEKKLSFSITY